MSVAHDMCLLMVDYVSQLEGNPDVALNSGSSQELFVAVPGCFVRSYAH